MLVSAADRIVAPLGSDNAFAGKLMPSASMSAACTTYSNVSGPRPPYSLATSCRVPVPTFIVSRGLPVTSTSTLK